MIESGQTCNEGFAEKNKQRCIKALIFAGRQEEALSKLESAWQPSLPMPPARGNGSRS